MSLGLTQSLTEMSARNISWGVKAACAYGWQPYHLPVPIVLKSGSLKLLEPSGPVQACIGITLPLCFLKSLRLIFFSSFLLVFVSFLLFSLLAFRPFLRLSSWTSSLQLLQNRNCYTSQRWQLQFISWLLPVWLKSLAVGGFEDLGSSEQKPRSSVLYCHTRLSLFIAFTIDFLITFHKDCSHFSDTLT